MKDKIIEILVNELESVYCDNCSHQEDDNCDDCNRKAMGWSLSRQAAEDMTDSIIKAIA